MSKSKKTPAQKDEYDSPWKEAIQEFLQPFLELLFPDIAKAIDWRQPISFLDTELRKITRSAAQGKRIVDALIEVGLLKGDRSKLYIHIEVQASRESKFPERVLTCYFRICERYDCPVTSLVVLADTDINWRPNHYHRESPGTSLDFHYSIAKLSDYRSKIKELEESFNPFAIFVLAHLRAQDSHGDQNLRVEYKAQLTRELHQKGFSQEQIRKLFNLIDWILELDQSHALLYREKMRKYEKEDHVSYINTFERLARDEERLNTEEQRKRADEQHKRAEQAERILEQQRQMLEQEQQRAAQQQQMLEQEQQRAEFLAKRLRELGEDPSSLLAEIEAKEKEQ